MIHEDIAYTGADIGLIFGISTLGYLVGTPLAGSLADRGSSAPPPLPLLTWSFRSLAVLAFWLCPTGTASRVSLLGGELSRFRRHWSKGTSENVWSDRVGFVVPVLHENT